MPDASSSWIEKANSPCSCPSRSSRWLSLKPPKILHLVHALLFAQLAPRTEGVRYVALSLCDLILEADNFSGNGNRLTASHTRYSAVAHGELRGLGLAPKNSTPCPAGAPATHDAAGLS